MHAAESAEKVMPTPVIRRKIYVSRRVTRLVWVLVTGCPLGPVPFGTED
jgi:hypothetical protein